MFDSEWHVASLTGYTPDCLQFKTNSTKSWTESTELRLCDVKPSFLGGLESVLALLTSALIRERKRLVRKKDGEKEGVSVRKAEERRNRGLNYSSVTNPVYDSFPLLVRRYPTFPLSVSVSLSLLMFLFGSVVSPFISVFPPSSFTPSSASFPLSANPLLPSQKPPSPPFSFFLLQHRQKHTPTFHPSMTVDFVLLKNRKLQGE